MLLKEVDESTGNVIDHYYLENNEDELQTGSIAFINNRLRIDDFVSTDGNGNQGRVGVVDLDTNYNVIYSRLLSLPPGNSSSLAVSTAAPTPTADGGWLMGETAPSTNNIYWVKFDSSGNVLWTQQSALTTGTQAVGGVVQNPNGSYTVLGTNSGSAMVLLLSSNGAAGCFGQASSIVADTPITTAYNYAQNMVTLGAPVYQDTLSPNLVSISTAQITCPGSTNCYTAYNGPLLCGKATPMLTPSIADVTTCSDSTFFTVSTATSLFNNYTDSLTRKFRAALSGQVYECLPARDVHRRPPCR